MRVSTEGSRAVTARRVSSVRFYPLAGAMSPLLLFVPLSLKRSSYLGMPEEYRAAPRAPFRSDGSPRQPVRVVAEKMRPLLASVASSPQRVAEPC